MISDGLRGCSCTPKLGAHKSRCKFAACPTGDVPLGPCHAVRTPNISAKAVNFQAVFPDARRIHQPAAAGQVVHHRAGRGVRALAGDARQLARLQFEVRQLPGAKFPAADPAAVEQRITRRIDKMLDGGDHWIVLGEVTALHREDDADDPLVLPAVSLAVALKVCPPAASVVHEWQTASNQSIPPSRKTRVQRADKAI